VHEGLWANGPAFPMESDLEHVLADSWREAITDTARYARLEAEQVTVSRSPLATISACAVRPAVKFAYRTVVFAGWRDGWRGMVKIGLDSASDVLVALHARRHRTLGTPGKEHYSIPEQRGSVRLIGIAAEAHADRAGDWLSRAVALGADVSLVTDGRKQSYGVRCRRVPRFTTLRVIRAVDAENQLRPGDAIVAMGGPAERIARLLPRTLQGRVVPIGDDVDPVAAIGRIDRAARAREAAPGVR